ncbi:MAG: ComEC/Rec2 family competence protein, partial [Eggerthellaceae bacterium]|nr:ComEC/Rec2 family competence protein [Eggerthellaceae bacterium]
MRSLVFGDRKDLFDSSLYGTVKRAGLAHLVAVSGAHLSITVAALTLALSALRCTRGLVVSVQVVVCVLFVLLTGAPHSALRACAMASCTVLSYFGKRRGFALNALSFCIIALVVLCPRLSVSVSFLLSALATAGIVLFASYAGHWFEVLMGGRFSGACAVLGMTSAAIAFTLPVTLALFGQVSLVAPVANLVATPAFTFLCVGGIVAGIVGAIAPFATLPAAFMCLCAQLFCKAVELLASVPYAATVVCAPAWFVSVALCGLAAFVLWRWPSPSRKGALRFIAALSTLVFAAVALFPLAHGTEVVMLDVGQGDAFVLRSGGSSLLVDTGNQEASVLKGLARHDVRHLDAVLITHPDDDHCGSLGAVLDVVSTGRVCVASDFLDCDGANCKKLMEQMEGFDIAALEVGDELDFGCFHATVIAPEAFADEGGNSDSLVVELQADCNRDGVVDWTVFTSGDAEADVLDPIVEAGAIHHADIVKVPHHGSAGGLSETLLDV